MFLKLYQRAFGLCGHQDQYRVAVDGYLPQRAPYIGIELVRGYRCD